MNWKQIRPQPRPGIFVVTKPEKYGLQNMHSFIGEAEGKLIMQEYWYER